MKILSLLLPILFVSCSLIHPSECNEDWHSEHLVSSFYYEWLNTSNGKSKEISDGSWDCGIGGNIPIISGAIFAVGYDTSFIIVMSHPYIGDQIEHRSFTLKNENGDFIVQDPADTIWLKESNDSFYYFNGILSHKSRRWLEPYQLKGMPDKSSINYYILNIAHYTGDIINGNTDRLFTYTSKNAFEEGRKKLEVKTRMKFTLIDADIR